MKFLTPAFGTKNNGLNPDHQRLEAGRRAQGDRLGDWRTFPREKLEGTGSHELAIWPAPRGAMSALEKKPKAID